MRCFHCQRTITSADKRKMVTDRSSGTPRLYHGRCWSALRHSKVDPVTGKLVAKSYQGDAPDAYDMAAAVESGSTDLAVAAEARRRAKVASFESGESGVGIDWFDWREPVTADVDEVASIAVPFTDEAGDPGPEPSGD